MISPKRFVAKSSKPIICNVLVNPHHTTLQNEKNGKTNLKLQIATATKLTSSKAPGKATNQPKQSNQKQPKSIKIFQISQNQSKTSKNKQKPANQQTSKEHPQQLKQSEDFCLRPFRLLASSQGRRPCDRGDGERGQHRAWHCAGCDLRVANQSGEVAAWRTRSGQSGSDSILKHPEILSGKRNQ